MSGITVDTTGGKGLKVLLRSNNAFMEKTMIDPATLAFDIDGVIADTMHLFLDILSDHYGVDSVRYTDITCYQLDECLNLEEDVLMGAIGRILEGNYRARLAPMADAGMVLKRIAVATGRLLMVTARSECGPIDEWMRQLLGSQHHRSRIVATGAYDAKTEVLLQHGIRWFVEDRLETCHLMKAAGIEPVVFRQPWNRQPHDYLEVGTWRELEQRIDFS